MGDDSRAIQEGRNRTALTRSELEQHRRQRQNVEEEMRLDEQKRRSSLSPLRTFREGAELLGVRFY